MNKFSFHFYFERFFNAFFCVGAATTMQVRKMLAPRQPINIEVNLH